MGLLNVDDVKVGATFFKPAEYESAVALLIEPKSVQRDVPNTYLGVTKNRDEVTGDVTVFWSEADLAAGKGVEVKGVTFGHPGITNKLSRALNESVVGRLGKKKFDKSPAPAWVINPVDPETFDKVASYYNSREAAVAEAIASVPSFD